MKTRLCLAILLSVVAQAICGSLDLTNAIHYIPPADFYGPVETHPRTDPGDNPFSLDGPEFFAYVKRGQNGGEIIFQRGMVGAYVGQGDVVYFNRVNAPLLKDELENSCTNISGYKTSAKVETIDGYNAADLTITRSPGAHPRFLYFCWIQIEANEALKLTAIAEETNSLPAVIASLKSLAIDKQGYFNALSFKQAAVFTNQLKKIEIGHVMRHGAPFGYCVLHTEEKAYSFLLWSGNVRRALDLPKIYFKKLENCSKTPNSLRIVVIDFVSKYQQNTINVEAESNATGVAGFQLGDVRSPAFQLGSGDMSVISNFAENQIPDGFKETAEYNVNATLFIRKQ